MHTTPRKRKERVHIFILKEKAKSKIIEVLKRHGCKVRDSKIDEILSLEDLPSVITKAFKEFLGTKFDLFVARTETGEYYLAECKGKSKEHFKNWVNVVEYDAHHKIASLPFPFLYFIWIEETDKIYKHEVVNPKDFEGRDDSYGKSVYLILEKLVHEMKPSSEDRLDLWLRLTPKVIKKWFEATGTD